MFCFLYFNARRSFPETRRWICSTAALCTGRSTTAAGDPLVRFSPALVLEVFLPGRYTYNPHLSRLQREKEAPEGSRPGFVH
ncbi:hypothetical protein SRHO_G00264990 [Serrasalmus rhombeus]